MTVQTDRIDLPKLERGAIVLLYQNLNSTIDSLATGWATEDAAFYTAMGRSDLAPAVEHIESGNFYPGHNPSLIDAPIDRYPNVSTMAMKADALPSTDDWAEQYNTPLAVEVMCKAKSQSAEPDQALDALAAEIVNLRIKRTVQAIIAIFKTDNGRTFNKVVPKIGNTPNVTVTDVFVRREEKGRGARWFWQGARIDYRVQQWVKY